MWKYLASLLILIGISIVSCHEERNKDKMLFGEWMYYYVHGDSMIYQFDTAQMIIRKFVVSQVPDSPGEDTIVSFERRFFYNQKEDTLFLDMVMPNDTGVFLIPSSYYLVRQLNEDSLIIAPELGPDISFKRHSDQWPVKSKQEFIDDYDDWLQRKIEGRE